jgi:hypothetical protein
MNMNFNISTDNVSQIINRLSKLPKKSNNLKDFIFNFKLLILYVTHNEFDEVKEWLMAYDVQSHMTVRGELVSCTVHPNTLPPEEEKLLEEDIHVLTEFVEHARKLMRENISH